MSIDIEKEVDLNYEERSRAPEGLGLFTEIIRVWDYMWSDQEKEGREYAIKFSARLYKNIVEELEESIRKIKNRSRVGNIKFTSQIKQLREKNTFYESMITELDEKINQLIVNNSSLDKFHTEYSLNRVFALTEFGQYRTEDKSKIENLDDKMERKRRKYFEIELKKRIEMWENKIDELMMEKRGIIESFKVSKHEEKEILLNLISVIESKQTEYINKVIEYNAIKFL